jgi:transposase
MDDVTRRSPCSRPNGLPTFRINAVDPLAQHVAEHRAEGLAGILEDRPRPGRPKEISPEQEAEIVEVTRSTKPKNATHWTVRKMARSQRISPASVHRIWLAYGLQPHRVKTFKFSNDPQFVHQVRDIVGLYMNPPDKALVLSVDEKSQIQALDRTQPILPLRPGLPEWQAHDYVRHGTTTLFAALNVLDETVIGQCQPRHRHQEFLKFLERLDTTPAGASWLNQIERWFAEITSKRIRRGTFGSVQELEPAIHSYIREKNHERKSLVWTATAAAILRKLRKCKRLQKRDTR